MITQDMIIDEVRKLAPTSCSKITVDSLLREDLVFSSLKFMMLLVHLEELLDCSIPIENSHEIRTVGDLLTFIKEVENQNERL